MSYITLKSPVRSALQKIKSYLQKALGLQLIYIVPPYGVIGNTWLVPWRVLTLIHLLSLLIAISWTCHTYYIIWQTCWYIFNLTVPIVSPLYKVYRWCTAVWDESSGWGRMRKTWNEWPSVHAVTSNIPLHEKPWMICVHKHMYVHTLDQRLMLLFCSLHQRAQESWQRHLHLSPSFQYIPMNEYVAIHGNRRSTRCGV